MNHCRFFQVMEKCKKVQEYQTHSIVGWSIVIHCSIVEHAMKWPSIHQDYVRYKLSGTLYSKLIKRFVSASWNTCKNIAESKQHPCSSSQDSRNYQVQLRAMLDCSWALRFQYKNPIIISLSRSKRVKQWLGGCAIDYAIAKLVVKVWNPVKLK